jgi:hypothetical protein
LGNPAAVFDQRYGDAIRQVQILGQPTAALLVLSQRTGPALALRSVVWVSLELSTGLPTPTLTPGRTSMQIMLSNVVELETKAILSSLSHNRSAMI